MSDRLEEIKTDLDEGDFWVCDTQWLIAEVERLRAHVDSCPYGPLGDEWWCTHIPAHDGDNCYEADGNTLRQAP